MAADRNQAQDMRNANDAKSREAAKMMAEQKAAREARNREIEYKLKAREDEIRRKEEALQQNKR